METRRKKSGWIRIRQMRNKNGGRGEKITRRGKGREEGKEKSEREEEVGGLGGRGGRKSVEGGR